MSTHSRAFPSCGRRTIELPTTTSVPSVIRDKRDKTAASVTGNSEGESMMTVSWRRDASVSNCCICGSPSSSAGVRRQRARRDDVQVVHSARLQHIAQLRLADQHGRQVQSFAKVARTDIVLQPLIDELRLATTPEHLADQRSGPR